MKNLLPALNYKAWILLLWLLFSVFYISFDVYGYMSQTVYQQGLKDGNQQGVKDGYQQGYEYAVAQTVDAALKTCDFINLHVGEAKVSLIRVGCPLPELQAKPADVNVPSEDQ
ncbi:hypothetical protein COB57_04325 [Candidatus Peregrinibacteria bacterium]|nr:MAG: hypothetical protein COB57_04325 [Candidatus Peregrinibacteria bacterium]